MGKQIVPAPKKIVQDFKEINLEVVLDFSEKNIAEDIKITERKSISQNDTYNKANKILNRILTEDLEDDPELNIEDDPELNLEDDPELNPSYHKLETSISSRCSTCFKCKTQIPARTPRVVIALPTKTRWVHPSCVGLDCTAGIAPDVLNKSHFSFVEYESKHRCHSQEESLWFCEEDARFHVDLFKFKLKRYTQSIFNALTSDKLKETTIVVSGDGRRWAKDCIQIIIKMAAANGVKSVWVGLNGLMSTPAVSAVIRERTGSDGSKASGAFILTASQNPGGPHEDLGVKFIMDDGGPALEGVTDKIYQLSKTILISEDLPDVVLSAEGVTKFGGPKGECIVHVIDSINDYIERMKSMFDFESIRKLVTSSKFTFCLDALHGVSGAYAKRLFVQELGARESCLINCAPREDLRGQTEILTGVTERNEGKRMKGKVGLSEKNHEARQPDFSAAISSCTDTTILGRRFCVTPLDSVAVIAANAVESIPYFKGVARNMPTSAALDVVGEKMRSEFFEVPTGWDIFGSKKDARKCSVWGEECSATSSDHICVKDGLWAVFSWLSILSFLNKEKLENDRLNSVEDIVRGHWSTYGRHYHARYEYEKVNSGAAKKLMANLVNSRASISGVNKFIKGIQTCVAEVVWIWFDVPKNQVIRYLLADGSRLVFRVSGAGTNATIRLFIEKYEKDPSKVRRDSKKALAPLVKIALTLSDVERYTKGTKPAIIRY